MTRILSFLLAAALSAAVFACVSRVESTWRAQIQAAANALDAVTRQHAALEANAANAFSRNPSISGKATSRGRSLSAVHNLDPALVSWLTQSDLSDPPPSLVPKIEAALGFPWQDGGDCVLVRKSMLHEISVAPVVDDSNHISQVVCAVLSISPQSQAAIESTLASVRQQFADWSRANVKRDGPEGDTLFRYTIPYSPQETNTLVTALDQTIVDQIGRERSALFHSWSDLYSQLGSLNLSLEVSKHTTPTGETTYEHKARDYDLTSEPPRDMWRTGPVAPGVSFPHAFRSIFPGGWPQLMQQEGIDLPLQDINDSGAARQ